MSWAATNLTKKSEKGKKNRIVGTSEEAEWERQPQCWTCCPVLDRFSWTARARGSTRRPQLVLFFAWSGQDV